MAEYHIRWDPTNKKWEASVDGGAFADLVEKPTVEQITMNGVSAPSGIASKGVVYYDSTANRVKFKENNGSADAWCREAGYPATGLDISGLTEDTAPDMAADFLVTHDASAGARKKVKACTINREEQHGGVIWNPNGITAAVIAIVWYAPYPVTITEARFVREDGSSGSVTVNFKKNNTTAVCTSDVTLTSSMTWYTGTLSVTTLAAGDYIQINLVSVAGSPTKIGFFLTVERTG